MEHEEIVQRLPELIDGELSDAEKATVEAHLAGCAACYQAMMDWRKAVRAVFAHPAPTSSASTEDLVREIMARLPAARSGETWLEFPDLRWLVPVIGFSAAVLLSSFLPYAQGRSTAADPVLADPNARVLSGWLDRAGIRSGDALFELFQEGI